MVWQVFPRIQPEVSRPAPEVKCMFFTQVMSEIQLSENLVYPEMQFVGFCRVLFCFSQIVVMVVSARESPGHPVRKDMPPF